ncbi:MULTISPECIES: hypothetical protein [Pseudoalteromonas]|uniref:Uncharacterized protein n=1 Tax=Pseudoalteromonas amylolytica TaxID=1859457 RepID=A0A1S1MUK3_9GAMM|nr:MULTISPECIES: hypothetical protein [Pseudoalteromonas]OHU87478.1 hypothetical protein BFC16_08435 [Pseudoalteromonas sp. JW3]OHU90921.1 hypothetical protein BET10_08550 [Pseudoalteromonas amylolytica]
MISLKSLETKLDACQSHIKLVFIPTKVFTTSFVTLLSNRKEQILILKNTHLQEYAAHNITTCSTTEVIKQLNAQDTSPKIIVVTPELLPHTVSSCRTMVYKEQRFIIPAFIELLLTNKQADLVIPFYTPNTVHFFIAPTANMPLQTVMQEYLSLLSAVGDHNALRQLSFLFTLQVEIHRLLTLQHYINAQEKANRNRYSAILLKAENQKRRMFELLEGESK